MDIANIIDAANTKMDDVAFFTEIKKITNGYLKPEVYQEIYNAAFNAPEGIVVDIGPAQGGSSISLGLGRRKSNKLSTIYSIDVFCKSLALKSLTDVELNVSQLRSNLALFDLDKTDTILRVGQDDLSIIKQNSSPIAVLFIDADGALDRDFEFYYNQLCPNARIIIDDCENIINNHGQRYLKWESRTVMDNFLDAKGYKMFSQICPLGKHYSTYRFAEYLISKGLIVIEKSFGNTILAIKPLNSPVLGSEHIADFLAIRTDIEREFHERNVIMRSYYNKISKMLPPFGEIAGVDQIHLFENSCEGAFKNWYTVQVCDWCTSDFETKNYAFKQMRINMKNVPNLVDILLSGKPYSRLVCDLEDSQFKTSLQLQNILSILMLPIFIEDKCWGIIAFLDNKAERTWSAAEISALMAPIPPLTNEVVKFEHIKQSAVSLE